MSTSAGNDDNVDPFLRALHASHRRASTSSSNSNNSSSVTSIGATAKHAVRFVPGASIIVLATEKAQVATVGESNNDNDENYQQDTPAPVRYATTTTTTTAQQQPPPPSLSPTRTTPRTTSSIVRHTKGDSSANTASTDDDGIITPEERTRLLVTTAIEETPPFVACVAFCLALNIMLATFFVGIFILYLHYVFGYGEITIPTEFPESSLCRFLQVWNRKLFWLVIITCLLGCTDLVVRCCVYAQAQDVQDYCSSSAVAGLVLDEEEQQQPPAQYQQQSQKGGGGIATDDNDKNGVVDINVHEMERLEVPCWYSVHTVVKLLIDVLFLVWMAQAFWVTNYGFYGLQQQQSEEEDSSQQQQQQDSNDCPNVYLFVHVYSTIVIVLVVLGMIASCLIWLSGCNCRQRRR